MNVHELLVRREATVVVGLGRLAECGEYIPAVGLAERVVDTDGARRVLAELTLSAILVHAIGLALSPDAKILRKVTVVLAMRLHSGR